MTNMRFQPFNFFRYVVIGAIAGLFSFLVSGIIRFFNIPVFVYEGEWVRLTASTVDINLRQQILDIGRFRDIGMKFLEFLQGTFNFNTIDFFGVLIGAVIVVLIGRIAVGFLKPTKFVLKFRILLSFLFGGMIFALFIPFLLGMPFVTTFVSMVVFGLVLGIIMQILVNWKALRWVQE